MFYTVYQTTNLVNGKIYIGKHQTNNPNDDYMGSGKNVRRAVNKYGVENFRKDVLHVFDNEVEMNTKEAELVTEEFCSLDTNYNLCPGGNGGFGYINSNISTDDRRTNRAKYQISDEQKLKISNSLKKLGHKPPANYGDNHWSGKTHTEKWKENHSKIMKVRQSGEKNSQFGTIWITDGNECLKIPKDVSIPDGWKRGRKVLKELNNG